MALEALRTNPFRSPAWKWIRAEQLRRGNGAPLSRRQDGEEGVRWISRAIRYQRAYPRNTTDEASLQRLAEVFPDIFWAHRLWQDPNNPARWEVEARVLARQDDAEISYLVGYPVDAIEAYVELFFDVREKLDHPGYVTNCVLGPSLQHLSDRQKDIIWKLYGYMCGPAVLDILTTQFVAPHHCRNIRQARKTLMADAEATLQLKASIALKTLPMDRDTKNNLLTLLTKLVEIERTTEGEKPTDAVYQHISQLMQYISISPAGPQDTTEDTELSFLEATPPSDLPSSGRVFNITGNT